MTFSLTLLFISLFFTVAAYAGNGKGDWQDVGNGGDAVLCQTVDNHTEYYALDYIESIYRWNYSPILPNFGGEIEIAHSLLDRLPEQYKDLKGRAKEVVSLIEQKIVIVDDLPNIRDEGRVAIPGTCKKMQLILQEGSGVKDFKFLVTGWIWEKMPASQKAIMLIHEAFFSLAEQDRVEYSSEYIRHAIGLLMANKFEDREYYTYIYEEAGLRN